MRGVLEKRSGVWSVKWATQWDPDLGLDWKWTPLRREDVLERVDGDIGKHIDFQLVWSKNSPDYEARLIPEWQTKSAGMIIPGPKGGYYFGRDRDGTIGLMLKYKPGRLHRFFMRWLLGLYWYDNN